MTAHNIYKQLRKKGSSILGVGFYSAVFASATYPDRVTKLGFSVNDPWLLFITNYLNKDNEHYPNIHSLYIDKDFNFFIATMEKLNDYNEGKFLAIKVLCRQFIAGKYKQKEFINLLAEYPEIVPKPKKLIKALNTITLDTTEGKNVDLHNGNIMFRGTVLVITDPWAEVDITYERDISEWAEEHENKYNKRKNSNGITHKSECF